MLLEAFKEDSVDIIASDHAPHSIEEKKIESVWEAKSGIPGLETTLPLLLTALSKGHVKLQDIIKATSERPARIFSLKNRGSIAKGNWADLTVVDLNSEYEIDASRFHSKAKYSPFDGYKVKGKVVKTFVNGQLAFDEDIIMTKPSVGQIIR
jgi:dihydroorotase